MKENYIFEIFLCNRDGDSLHIDGEFDDRCSSEIMDILKAAAKVDLDVRICTSSWMSKENEK